MGDVRRNIPWWMRVMAVAVLVVATLAGCGSDGEDGQNAMVLSALSNIPASLNNFTLTVDEFGLQRPTLLYSISTPQYVRLDTAIGASTADGWNLKPLTMIYIDEPAVLKSGVVYALDPLETPAFPGVIVFFNGADSTCRSVVAGTLTLTDWGAAAGSYVSGIFDLTMSGGDSCEITTPNYRMAGSFSYVLGSESSLD